MLTIAGGIILAVIILAALPFILAVAWKLAPYALAGIGVVFAFSFLATVYDHDPAWILAFLAALFGLPGAFWVARQQEADDLL